MDEALLGEGPGGWYMPTYCMYVGIQADLACCPAMTEMLPNVVGHCKECMSQNRPPLRLCASGVTVTVGQTDRDSSGGRRPGRPADGGLAREPEYSQAQSQRLPA